MAGLAGRPDFDHAAPSATGVLLCNLGSPDAPTASAVRRYLRQFLNDRRVIERPRLLWWPILEGIVLRVRPAKVARLYREIWGDGPAAPLIETSRVQAAGLSAGLAVRFGVPVPVAVGMRYGRPSIATALEELGRAGCRRVLVLPLYPQYASATVATVFDEVGRVLAGWRWLPEVRFVNHYGDEPAYIAALASSVREVWAEGGPPEVLVQSYHGIPRSTFLAGDPYHCECHQTARLLAEALELPEAAWRISFQSRFGREEWLEPYTERLVASLAAAGVRTLDVICPGFSADCLETLEEVGGQIREVFEAAGGGRFRYIAALNDRPDHLAFLVDLAARHLAGWIETAGHDAGRVDRLRRVEALRDRAINTCPRPAGDEAYR